MKSIRSKLGLLFNFAELVLELDTKNCKLDLLLLAFRLALAFMASTECFLGCATKSSESGTVSERKSGLTRDSFLVCLCRCLLCDEKTVIALHWEHLSEVVFSKRFGLCFFPSERLEQLHPEIKIVPQALQLLESLGDTPCALIAS